MSEKRGRNCGQIWVETVIYTLIGLAIIGILLSVVKPAIEKKQDQILIDTSLSMMSSIEGSIEDTRYYGVGNTRNIDIKIKRGKLEINSQADAIEFTINSRYKYSEPGQIIEVGNINVLTKEKAKTYDVFLFLNYSGILNLTYNGREIIQTLQPAPVPYALLATNMGKKGNLTNIDFS